MLAGRKGMSEVMVSLCAMSTSSNHHVSGLSVNNNNNGSTSSTNHHEVGGGREGASSEWSEMGTHMTRRGNRWCLPKARSTQSFVSRV
jgi:hypothetical protein